MCREIDGPSWWERTIMIELLMMLLIVVLIIAIASIDLEALAEAVETWGTVTPTLEPPGDEQLYLPLVITEALSASQHFILLEPQSWGLESAGATLQEAQAGQSITIRADLPTMFAWNSGPASPYQPDYTLTRGFVVYDLRHIPAGVIVSATLELVPGSLHNHPVTLHEGLWAGPHPTAADWAAYGAPLGVIPTPDWEAVQYLPLPALSQVPVPTTLRWILRTDETLALGQHESHGGFFVMRPYQDPEQPVSRLHLWVRPLSGEE